MEKLFAMSGKFVKTHSHEVDVRGCGNVPYREDADSHTLWG